MKVIASAKLLLDLTVRRWRQRIMESIDLDHPPQLSPGDSDVVEKSE